VKHHNIPIETPGPTAAEKWTRNSTLAAVKGEFGRCDCLIMAAAVADYTPMRAFAGLYNLT